MPFLNPKIRVPSVEGISNDPGACNRAFRQPVALLLLGGVVCQILILQKGLFCQGCVSG